MLLIHQFKSGDSILRLKGFKTILTEYGAHQFSYIYIIFRYQYPEQVKRLRFYEYNMKNSIRTSIQYQPQQEGAPVLLDGAALFA
jgi:hypothetical protein